MGNRGFDSGMDGVQQQLYFYEFFFVLIKLNGSHPWLCS